ncbi:MAG TPA: ATP-grasp ribosomal peptide maturase [Pseudonocardiaceae bacterium]|nr:ATP-grasp ribosomal peptide maturase [Pseudonocardiaceae bacterium]
MTVLILAREIEPQVDRVVEELAARDVPVFRSDLAAFPQALTLDAQLEPEGWNGTLATEHRRVQLSEIRSVWYRHPSHFELPEGMSRPERRHAAAEARVGVAGVLCSLDALWVNYPSREADALKPRQLDVARRCGLRVPRSLITNTPVGVRSFATGVDGPLAGKNLSAASLVESNHLQTAYTRRLGVAELADLSGVETTAHLFQEFIENKEFEVRATVVGKRVFAAAIHAGSETARIDFRADYSSLDYSAIEPPPPVRTGMLAFMRAFDLSFGAFDFAVTTDGEWIMFECNTFGQYGWLEDALDLPITSALADLLESGARS